MGKAMFQGIEIVFSDEMPIDKGPWPDMGPLKEIIQITNDKKARRAMQTEDGQLIALPRADSFRSSTR